MLKKAGYGKITLSLSTYYVLQQIERLLQLYEAGQGFFRTLLGLLVGSAEWFEAIREGVNRKTG